MAIKKNKKEKKKLRQSSGFCLENISHYVIAARKINCNGKRMRQQTKFGLSPCSMMTVFVKFYGKKILISI